MNFISNIFGFFYNIFYNHNIDEPITDDPVIVEPITNEPITNEPIINNVKPVNYIIYIFINTANIYNATQLMLNRLKTDDYNNKYIKIYLLKSHTLEPLFNGKLIINNNNLDLIERKLSKKRRHLHTFIDAIDSFIEYNNIKNYNIYY